ncbi:MAG: hypothetical protein GX604_06625 [Actinobacteria bacterium]|nr:hypothetical protein [Actinomycetota bacterium]
MSNPDIESFGVLVNIQDYSDGELKALSEELQREEREVSRRRRIIHGKLDIIRAEIVRRLRDKHQSGGVLFSEGDISLLGGILSGKSLTGEGDPQQD